MDLIIDTSSEYCMVALAHERELIASSVQLHANQLSRILLPSIESLLSEAGLTIGMIKRVAVGVGPGSYTGTRVGVAVGKSLAFALEVPLLSFCSLLAFLPVFQGRFACVMPARSGEFFLLKGALSENSLSLSFSELVSELTLIEMVQTVDAVLGKPLAEVQEKLPIASWLTPNPQWEAVLLCLSSLSSTVSSPELIYLHNPQSLN